LEAPSPPKAKTALLAARIAPACRSGLVASEKKEVPNIFVHLV
jgi:hypothetical protein